MLKDRVISVWRQMGIIKHHRWENIITTGLLNHDHIFELWLFMSTPRTAISNPDVRMLENKRNIWFEEFQLLYCGLNLMVPIFVDWYYFYRLMGTIIRWITCMINISIPLHIIVVDSKWWTIGSTKSMKIEPTLRPPLNYFENNIFPICFHEIKIIYVDVPTCIMYTCSLFYANITFSIWLKFIFNYYF